MDMPVSMIIENFRKDLVSVVNNSGLHPTILEMCVKDVYEQVKDLAERQSEVELAQYEQEQSKEETK